MPTTLSIISPDACIDAYLAGKARRGDQRAFSRLYDRNAARVYHLLRRLTGGDTEAAEDLTQETFVAAFGALAAWQGRGAYSTYLCGIAVRQYAAARRRTDRQPPTSLLEDDAPFAADRTEDPLSRCVQREADAALESAIAGLPAACREAFVLVRVEGMRYQEAADMLGIPLGTLQSRLHRATRLLHEGLTHLIYDNDEKEARSHALR